MACFMEAPTRNAATVVLMRSVGAICLLYLRFHFVSRSKLRQMSGHSTHSCSQLAIIGRHHNQSRLAAEFVAINAPRHAE